MKPRRWSLALLAVAAISRTSFALEPAGGPPEAAELADEQPDASAGDEVPLGTEPSSAATSTSTSTERSWLSRGPAERAPGAGESKASGQGSGLTLGAVLIVLGLGGAAIVLRYRRRKLGAIPKAESRLTVLSSSRIGPKAFAVSAQVGGRVLLLGVTDHSVSHLGWLDSLDTDAVAAADAAPRPEPGDVIDDPDDLPDDYPGSALRDASGSAAPLASAKNLLRFREVLAGAVQGNSELRMRPSYTSAPPNAASTLAAQTKDVFKISRPAPPRAATIPSLRRERQRRRQSLPPPNASAPPRATGAPAPSDSGVEGQVAGLRALRNGG